MPGRHDPQLVARRRAAALDLNASRWGAAGAKRGRGRASNGRGRSHQPIQVANPRAFHAATPREHLTPEREWYRIQDAITGGAVDVYIYDEIGFWGVTAQDFVMDLQQVQATTLNVHLNSPGGEVFDGIAIYNALVNHPADVHVTVDALAASIASVIAMAGDTLTMGRHSQLMIHEPYGMCLGNAADMAMMIAQLDRCADNIAAAYADRAGGTVEAWRDAMRAETWYTGAEAVAAGLADQVVASTRGGSDTDGGGEDDVAARWDLGVFQFAGRHEAPPPDLTVNKRRPPKQAPAVTDQAPDQPAPPDPQRAAPATNDPDPLAALLDLEDPDPVQLLIDLKEAAS
jgi:ATP-dependent protease ClpP protease subunit